MRIKPNELTTKQLSEIIGISAVAINKQARKGRLAYRVLNDRGDKAFAIKHLPESYQIAVVEWQRKRGQRVMLKLKNSNNRIEQKDNLRLNMAMDHLIEAANLLKDLL